MSDPTIIITGANGFIGRSLVSHFHAKGWNVRALVHSPPAARLDGVAYIPYRLEDAPEDTYFEGARSLVHCAHVGYAERKDADAINVSGAQSLLRVCRQYGIKFVFLSSFSAHDEAESHYGRTKLRIESLLDPTLDLALRPGLVLGREGLFASISNMISRHTFIPLVGGGCQPVQTVAVEDLCVIVERGLAKNICGIYKIANPEAITLRELYELVGRYSRKQPRFFPVPTWCVHIVCRGAECIGLQLPISSESVLGLKHLRSFDTTADLRAFGIPVKGCREALEALARE